MSSELRANFAEHRVPGKLAGIPRQLARQRGVRPSDARVRGGKAGSCRGRPTMAKLPGRPGASKVPQARGCRERRFKFKFCGQLLHLVVTQILKNKYVMASNALFSNHLGFLRQLQRKIEDTISLLLPPSAFSHVKRRFSFSKIFPFSLFF